MLFKRRDPPTIRERVRIAVWPRRSWSRSSKYVMSRVGRLKGTPHAIAFGFACGVMVSFTPFIGLHFILAGVLAYLFRVSIIASAFGTFIGNPLSFPFIWVGAYRFGNLLLGGAGNFSGGQLRDGFERLWEGFWSVSGSAFLDAISALWPLIKPMMVGGVPLGIVAGTFFYYIVRRMVEVYQASRARLANDTTAAPARNQSTTIQSPTTPSAQTSSLAGPMPTNSERRNGSTTHAPISPPRR